MPLMKLHINAGAWDDEERATLLEVVHHVMVDVFQVPPADRYQILSEHAAGNLRALHTK